MLLCKLTTPLLFGCSAESPSDLHMAAMFLTYINFTKQVDVGLLALRIGLLALGIGLLALRSCHLRNSLSTSSNPNEDCRGFRPSVRPPVENNTRIVIQSCYHRFLLNPFQFITESFHTQVQSNNTQCQTVSLKTKHVQTA
jgi:hypothetical protein